MSANDILLASQTGGLDKNQLMLMRMMLQRQQAPTIQIQPVQDIGGGIAQGVGNILNAILQNRANQQMIQQMDSWMAQEAAAQRELARQTAQAAQEQADFYGVSPGVLSGLTNEIKNDLARQRMLDTQVPAREQTLLGMSARPQVSMNLDDTGRIPMTPTVGLNMLPTLSPEQARQIALNDDAYKQALAVLVQAAKGEFQSNLTNGLDVDTVSGYNKYALMTGQAPATNSPKMQQDYNAALKGRIENTAGLQTLPYVAPQAAASLGNTLVGIQGGQLNNNAQAIINSYLPQLKDLELRSAGQGVDKTAVELRKQQILASLVAQVSNNPSILSDPQQMASLAVLFGYASGGNPYGQIPDINAGLGDAKNGPKFQKNLTSLTRTIQGGTPQGTQLLPGLASLGGGPAPAPAPAPTAKPASASPSKPKPKPAPVPAKVPSLDVGKQRTLDSLEGKVFTGGFGSVAPDEVLQIKKLRGLDNAAWKEYRERVELESTLNQKGTLGLSPAQKNRLKELRAKFPGRENKFKPI